MGRDRQKYVEVVQPELQACSTACLTALGANRSLLHLKALQPFCGNVPDLQGKEIAWKEICWGVGEAGTGQIDKDEEDIWIT